MDVTAYDQPAVHTHPTGTRGPPGPIALMCDWAFTLLECFTGTVLIMHANENMLPSENLL